MRKLFLLLLFIAILFSGCSLFEKKRFFIGIDPTFSPVQLAGQGSQVFGFSADLLDAIAKVEKIELVYETAGTENLFSSLDQGQFQGILSSLYPKNYETEVYAVSENYFCTGPVLVVPEEVDLSELSEFDSRIVGVLSNSDAFYIVQKYPHILISTFTSVPFLFEALSYRQVDALVVSLLDAQAFVLNLYRKVLKIASPPLNNEGLRLIQVKGKDAELIRHFNKGLSTCKRKGIYQNLLKKWQLNQPTEDEAAIKK